MLRQVHIKKGIVLMAETKKENSVNTRRAGLDSRQIKIWSDLLDTLDMVKKNLLTQSVSMYAGYSNALHMPGARGTVSVTEPTNSETVLTEGVLALYDRIVDKNLPIRRFYVFCNNVTEDTGEQQISLFDGLTESEQEASFEIKKTDHAIQETMNEIKDKFGKNAIFKSADLQESATQLERNMQIGGHKSGKRE